MIAWLLGSFVVLMVLGVPIGISLGLASMGGILLLDGGNIVTVAQRTFEGMNSWALLAVPLYTFAGYTMSKGGVSKNLMDFCYSIVGHIYGGLAHVNVFASMIFAGISGSAVADTAGVSGMFMPQMVKKGYSTELSVAVTGVSSTIGIIIPPSIPMVVIAGICGISTGKMFVGGIIPGILIGLMQMILSYFFAKKEGVEKEPGHFTFGAVGRAFLKSWPALMMPVIIIGTITSGIVSPTEAGAIAVAYGLVVGGLVYRELTFADIKFAFTETVRISGRIFVVIGAAKLFTVMLTTAGFDRWLTGIMLGVSSDPTVILIMILLLFFVVTMFMESIAALTLFMPIVYPIAMTAGVDPTVLGVLVTVVIGIGLVTPPVGMCIYVACDLMKIRVGSTMKYVIPYILGTFVVIAILIAFPQLITALGTFVGSGA
ncbi:MAG TPA: TRAP transporter large permease [Candidatus Intestinimonas stercorigallinarum]|nr:TRAP transporter large permease [Candidatus Intestinimonas stercorigallinarum]